MRPIKFRGKRKYGEGFVYGGISFEEEKVFITYPELNGEDKTGYYMSTEVIPETVGQYIWLSDRNDKMIYDGDVAITHFSNGGEIKYVVEYDLKEGRYVFSSIEPKGIQIFFRKEIIENVIEVIGTIHDKPESVEGITY